MARPFRLGATGGPGLLLQAGPITPTRRRDVPLSVCGWKVSVDDVLQRHATPSQTGPASTPEAIENQPSSGGPLEKYQCSGAGSAGRPEPGATGWISELRPRRLTWVYKPKVVTFMMVSPQFFLVVHGMSARRPKSTKTERRRWKRHPRSRGIRPSQTPALDTLPR